MPPPALRVGLIGYGYAGRTFHAPLIAGVPGLELAAVSSRDAARVHADWPAVEVLADAHSLIARADLDLVVIASPNDSHHPLAHAALMAGRNVVVDKPFTLTLAQARELAALAQARGHQATQLSVKPSMANLVLWRSLYVHDGRVQVDAFHLGPTLRHYPGVSAPLLDAAAAAEVAAGEAQRLHDIERFRVFSDGFLVNDPRRPGFVGDARYAMQPTAIAPIWGLEWRAAGAATEFVSRHEFSPAMRSDFLAMLLGRELSAAR